MWMVGDETEDNKIRLWTPFGYELQTLELQVLEKVDWQMDLTSKTSEKKKNIIQQGEKNL